MKMFAVTACSVLVLVGIAGDAASLPFTAPSGIVGFLSPDGTFTPYIRKGGATSSSVTTVTGTIELSLSLSVVSNLPSKATVYCGLSASVSGASASGVVDAVKESDQEKAKPSGSGYVCQLSIPYKWHLAALSSPTPDVLSLGYTVTALNSDLVGRTSAVSLGTMSVPKSGATTSFSENGRL